MELLSQPIKVNYQRQNAAAGGERERERGPCPENCIALMNNIISENGEETRSRTYQRKTERGEARGRERERERERERDGTQHWLPNYAFYHFSHNRVPPFFSCPVYSCSCSSAALMRKIKNNHTMLYLHLRPPNYFLPQHLTHTHTHTHTHTPNPSHVKATCAQQPHFFFFLMQQHRKMFKNVELVFVWTISRRELASVTQGQRLTALCVVACVLTLWLVQLSSPFPSPYCLSPHVPGSQS